MTCYQQPEGFYCSPLPMPSMPEPATSSEEMHKLLGEMEADAIWGNSNYIDGSVGQILAEKEIRFCGWVRTLEAEHRMMREALNEIDNTISGSNQWWKKITSKILSSITLRP